MNAPVSLDLLKDSEAQRRTMVDCQIRTFDVTDHRLIQRFLDVPRELFVPANVKALAYSDIGFLAPAASPEQEARYLIPPLVLARMMQGARLKPSDRVLDVAAGTGYSTAILAGLVGQVVALEVDEAMRGDLETRLRAFGLQNVAVRHGALPEGAPSEGPFDVIFMNGAIQTSPDHLFGQLADGGRLVAIRRTSGNAAGRAAKAMCYEKRHSSISARYLFDAGAPCLRAFQEAPQFTF
jgi:protein-L-isoaspartate(D-aspartate) O-methyltransferase